ncbi:hypothetical protein QNI19_34220 [Cytophagaceae bacterium DM2B3-1]|uniref:Uncharacterized protein n=1 Tax=Xanthocytophaga flava TaxID=3048013 RepID=A0ABT7CW99_9BACT|nr:hypothetical protein [Xanthocytophaga flavus]MDJ1467413.1 hypothetical protein [Xanthocytophaga flavus]MDJ1498049.1 hypothetical protein [Xanthocytophaga flavus]
MSNQLAIRSSGWETADSESIKAAYLKIQSEIGISTPQTIIQINDVKAPTHAEHFGLYVRELFAFYTATLTSMRLSSQWIALNVHTTYHSRMIKTASNIVTITTEGDEVDVTGYYFNPVAFNFEWIDNTLDPNWKPWGWKIPVLCDDPDDTNFFYDIITHKGIIHQGSIPDRIFFYGFSPADFSGLQFFERVCL